MLNKTQAKRIACSLTASSISKALLKGWAYDELKRDNDSEPDEKDILLIERALTELMNEMLKRSDNRN